MSNVACLPLATKDFSQGKSQDQSFHQWTWDTFSSSVGRHSRLLPYITTIDVNIPHCSYNEAILWWGVLFSTDGTNRLADKTAARMFLSDYLEDCPCLFYVHSIDPPFIKKHPLWLKDWDQSHRGINWPDLGFRGLHCSHQVTSFCKLNLPQRYAQCCRQLVLINVQLI